MKIAFVTFEYPPAVQGGAGVYAENLTRELARAGNEVHVIAPQSRHTAEHEVREDVIVHGVGFVNRPMLRAPSFWLALRRRFKVIAREVGGFDLVHGNSMSDFSLDRGITNMTPRVVTVHHMASDVVEVLKPSIFDRLRDAGGEIGLGPTIQRLCVRRADLLLAVSEHTRSGLISTYNVRPDRVVVVHNGGGEMSREFSRGEIEETRRKYDVYDRPCLLFVGRVDDRRKGLDVLLQAFKSVLLTADSTLVIAGGGDQQPGKHLARSLGIEERVRFCGYVSDPELQRLYAACDILVAPSRLEGFGLTLVEAMAAGKPIVATRVGAIPEIVKDNVNGRLVGANDEHELASAVLELLMDTSRARAMGQTNARESREHYTWQAAAKRTAEVYAGLVSA